MNECKALTALVLNLCLMWSEKGQATHEKLVAFSIVFVSINREMVSAVARAAPFHALSSHELKNGHFIYSDAYAISH